MGWSWCWCLFCCLFEGQLLCCSWFKGWWFYGQPGYTTPCTHLGAWRGNLLIMVCFICLVNVQYKLHLTYYFNFSAWRLLGLKDMALAMRMFFCLGICFFCRCDAFQFVSCFLVHAFLTTLWLCDIICYCSCAVALMRMHLVHVHSLSLLLLMNLLLTMHLCYPQASVWYRLTLRRWVYWI